MTLKSLLNYLEGSGTTVLVQLSQVHEYGALIKGAFGIGEHVAHNVLPATTEYEVDIAQRLNISPQQSFHIHILKLSYLLKLVNRFGHWFQLLRLFQQQCVPRVRVVLQRD